MGDAEAPKLEADTVKKEVAEEPEQPKKKKAKTKKSEKVHYHLGPLLLYKYRTRQDKTLQEIAARRIYSCVAAASG